MVDQRVAQNGMLLECEFVPKTYLISWCWRWTSRWHRTGCCVWTCTWDLPDKLVLMVDQQVAQNHMLCECELVPGTYLISWCWRLTSGWYRPYSVWVWTCTRDSLWKLVLKVDQQVAQNGMLYECELVPKTYLISLCWRWTSRWHRTVCCVSVNLYPRLTW